jgi:hypothetical protein
MSENGCEMSSIRSGIYRWIRMKFEFFEEKNPNILELKWSKQLANMALTMNRVPIISHYVNTDRPGSNAIGTDCPGWYH